MEQRQIRRKHASRSEQVTDEFDHMLDVSDEDSDEDGTLMSGTTAGFTRTMGRTSAMTKSLHSKSIATGQTRRSSAATAKSSRASKAAVRLPSEADGEVVDLLGPSSSKYINGPNDADSDSDSDDAAMEFDDDGRLIVRDDETENRSGPRLYDSSMTGDHLSVPQSKRPRTANSGTAKTGKGSKNNKRRGRNSGLELGSSYRSKKAGGDVRRKGQKFAPYAFVPLDGRSYTKKNRKVAVDQMSSVVRKGKKRKRG